MPQEAEVKVRFDAFPDLLYGENSKAAKMLRYVLNNMNPYTNVLIARIEDIAKGSGMTRQTAAKRMDNYYKADLIRKAGPCLWMVNPDMCFIGDSRDLDALRAAYREYPEYEKKNVCKQVDECEVIPFPKRP